MTVIREVPFSVGTRYFVFLLPCLSTKPIRTSFSITPALVAGVPSPLRSTSSDISLAPADSIVERSESSVNRFLGVVFPSFTLGSLAGSSRPSDKREALKEAGFSINPAINQYDAKRNSTIVTNGDREFRVVIYNADTFEGIQFSQNSDAYTYFPSFWDSTFYTGMLDISGTTRENPAEYNTFVLEPTIKFAMADNSFLSNL